MQFFKEVKRIAQYVQKIKKQAEQLSGKLDTADLEWFSAEFVTMTREELREIASDEGDYYCQQWSGYSPDDYYGYLYFKTDVPGQYVKVYYSV